MSERDAPERANESRSKALFGDIVSYVAAFGAAWVLFNLPGVAACASGLIVFAVVSPLLAWVYTDPHPIDGIQFSTVVAATLSMIVAFIVLNLLD